MKLIISLLVICLSNPAFASFGFNCESKDKKVSTYVIEYFSMLSIEHISIDDKIIGHDQFTTNFFLGNTMSLRIVDNDLKKQYLVAELTPDKNYTYAGPASYLNNQGETVNTQLTCTSTAE